MSTRPGRRGLTNGLVRDAPRGIGRTNGLVNGTRGRTNGLVNGTRERTNGLVNGTSGSTNGLVNGTRGRTNGFVNGSGFVNGLPLKRNPFGIVTHRDLRRGAALVALGIVAILLLGVLLGTTPVEPSRFGIDGDFTEWTAVPRYSDPADVSPEVDLAGFAVHREGDHLFVYGTVRGTLFAGPNASMVYVLLNGGDPRSPGYAATPDFGANIVAELYGWDGALQGTILRAWPDAVDRDNATALGYSVE